MAPRTPPDILETEWDILDALWPAERATAREVTEDLASRRGWAYSTVKTLLDRMVDKELVVARQVGNVWKYTPACPARRPSAGPGAGWWTSPSAGAAGRPWRSSPRRPN